MISHADAIEPDIMLSRQSDSTLLCLPSNANEKVFGDKCISTNSTTGLSDDIVAVDLGTHVGIVPLDSVFNANSTSGEGSGG